MGGVRRAAMAGLVVAASLGSAGAVAVVSATPSAALPSCTDNWVGPSSGTTNWNASSSDWSSGFPTSSSVVCISEPGTYTVDLNSSSNSSIGALQVGGGSSGTQTVVVDGSSANVTLSLASASTVASGGVLALAPSSGYTILSGPGVTVNSGGTFSTSGASNTAYLRSSITNNGTVTIGAANTAQDQSTSTANDGTFTVAGGGNLSVSSGSGSFINAGAMTVTGGLTESSGTFTQTSGSIAGSPVLLTGGALVDTAGTGAFDVKSNVSMSGTIPAGQTVTVDGSTTNTDLTLTGTSVTDDGTLALDPNSGYAMVDGSPLTVAAGASLTTTGAHNTAYLRSSITNNGTVTIGAANTAQDQSTSTANDGTFTVAGGGNLSVSSGSGSFINAGAMTVTGGLTESSGTFTQTSGSIAGSPVLLTGGALVDTAGTGAFDVKSNVSMSGTIPAGQTVTVDGSTTNTDLTLTGTSVTDDGTLALDPNSGYAILSGSPLTLAAGASLGTSGTSNTAYLRVPVTNQAGGTVTIGAADTRQDSNTATSNAGTFQVANGGHLTLSGSSTLTGAGTLGVTVNGTSGTGGISGPGITLASGSTLAVATVGTPTVGTVFTPIGGPVTGTFTTLSFGPNAYAVAYPGGAVQLTTEPAFTLTPAPMSPKENVPTGTVVLGNIGSASDGTGIYSATVNWGDGSGTGPATVTITGSTGTVTGSHTYTTPGVYTVTTTLANTDGTTLTTTESVTVTGPTVTGFSKTLIKQGKKLSTVVSGTGLDASAVVTTSNPGVTVVSAKVGKPTKKHPNPTLKVKLSATKTAVTGPINVTITQDTGTVTVTAAITVVS